MRHDQPVTEFTQPEPILAAPLSGVVERAPQRPLRLLARVTFCFAWLFGLEAFLTGAVNDPAAPEEDCR